MNRNEIALALHDAGWHPIPLPFGKKHDPPPGRTGYSGKNMMRAEIERFDWASHSIGVRMPDGVIGIDVDSYKSDGPNDWLDLRARLGELPPSVVTTARGGGAGIRFYRVPAGTAIANPAPTIEAIQWFHRYAVVAPSTNPSADDAPYQWIDEQSGEVLDLPPDVSDLPELPWSWLTGLATAAPKGSKSGRRATQAEVQEFLNDNVDEIHKSSLMGVESALSKPRRKGRHDTLVEVACWAMREAAAGLYSAEAAVAVLGSWWDEVMDTGDPSDVARAAGPEFGNALCYAIAEALADPQRVAEIRREHTIEGMLDDDAPQPEAEGEDDFDPSFAPVDLRPWLTGEVEVIMPELLLMSDGRGLLYRSRLNMLHGDSGSGKSWIMAMALKQEIGAGRTSMVLDLEDNPAPLTARLRQINVAPSAIMQHLVFVNPRAEFAYRNVSAIIRAVIERKVTHVYIDSLGEAFGIDGVNENDDWDVGPWLQKVCHRIIDETGAGVTLIDHVPKSTDQPLHPSGSKRKRASITGANWFVMAPEPLSKEAGGKLRMQCGKDRHGNYRRGDTVAEITMEVIGPITSVSIEPMVVDESRNVDVELMELVIRGAEKYRPHELSKNALVKATKECGADRRKEDIAGAIDLAVLRGFLVETEGPRRSRMFSYARDYEPMSAREWVDNGR